MSSKLAIRVSEEVMKEIITPYAELREYSVEVAVDRLLHIGYSRHKALQSYSDATTKAAKPAKKRAAKKAPGEKKASKKKKKRASSPPLAVAAGEANAPAPVADQEPAAVAEPPQFDDDFNPVPPAATPVESVTPPTQAAPPEFDPFETYDADAPDDPEDPTQAQPVG